MVRNKRAGRRFNPTIYQVRGRLAEKGASKEARKPGSHGVEVGRQ